MSDITINTNDFTFLIDSQIKLEKQTNEQKTKQNLDRFIRDGPKTKV